jgi:hypothetical protein
MNQQAQINKEYGASAAAIRKILKRLNETPYEKHFLIRTAQPTWTDLNDIRRIEIKMQELSDLVLREGEYAIQQKKGA